MKDVGQDDSGFLQRSFFARDPVTCARDLIGKRLVHGSTAGIVIETEAYAEHGDEACHLFTRPSARRFAEENPPGTAYVYLNYGIHWLANVLTRDETTGESGFVLLRALEPCSGLELMRTRRNQDRIHTLCSGPGKLAQALGIGPDHHGRDLCGKGDFRFETTSSPTAAIISDRRVGISAAQELLWRFLVEDHPGVSVHYGKA